MGDLGTPVVIDNGSDTIKAGLSGDDAPRSVFHSIVGKPKSADLVFGDQKNIYIGDEADAKSGVLKLAHPIEHGLVTDWEFIESVWNYTFYSQLRITPSANPLLLTEIPFNPRPNREKMTQIAFESFGIPAFYAAIQPVLSLYSSGRTTGLVLESGEGVTHVVPVREGYAVPNAIKKIDVSGQDITKYLLNLLTEKINSFDNSSRIKIVREIKESLSNVALDLNAELANPANSADKLFELPDGQVIYIGNERFRAPEVFFQPGLIGLNAPGPAEVIYNSIMECDEAIRGDLGRILLSGGNTMFPGIAERLTKDLNERASSGIDFKVSAPPERKFLAWIGGSILASLSSFQQNWILKSEYDEVGPSIVHTKSPNFS